MTRPRAKLAVAILTILAGLAILVWATQPGQIWTLTAPDAKTGRLPPVGGFQLDNGLEVITVPLEKAADFTVMAWYRVGAADDPDDRPGLAHYLEHVTFEALGSHQETKDTRRSPSRKTTGPEAFTSHDYTAYYHIVPAKDLARALQVEADRLSKLNIDDSAVDGERRPVIDERMRDIDSNPHSFLEEALRSAVFPKSSYGRPVVASEAETRRTTAQDLKRFWEEWYTPGNLILVVVGPVDSAPLRTLIEEKFSSIAVKAPTTRNRSAAACPRPGRLVVQAKVDDTPWARMSVVPSFSTANHRQVVSLQLLALILANGRTGRLDRALVEQFRVAREVTVEYQSDALGNSPFVVYVTSNRTSDTSLIESTFGGELASLAYEGVRVDELAQAKQRALQDFTAAWDNPVEAASLLGAARVTGRQVNDVLNSPQLLLSITADEVRAAAKSLFMNHCEVTGVVTTSPR